MVDAGVDEMTRAPAARAQAGHACPACRAIARRIFYEASNVPANSCILFATEAEAKQCPTSDIRLVLCEACGFIFNAAFDQAKTEYSGRYEETQGFSGTFNRFHRSLAERLIERYDLNGKRVIEIGCGKGEFLFLLAELGGNRCLGIDPGVHIGRLPEPARGELSFVADFYSERLAHHPVDFLACKMTLEHIAEAEQFVSTVRRGLGEQTGTIVFFQIPEALRILRECAFEDIYHEHCSYFTPGSLARLFRRCGFDVVTLDVEYAGQYLTIEARPRDAGASPLPPLPVEKDLSEVKRLVATFPLRCEAKLARWRRILQEARLHGQRVCLWGSGSKAVAFLAAADRAGTVAHVTDINPYRHDHFMPGSGQRIVPPGELAGIEPDLVIAMNEVYLPEIRNDLAVMGLAPELRSL
jgi:SAM-dependent methyltransferase